MFVLITKNIETCHSLIAISVVQQLILLKDVLHYRMICNREDNYNTCNKWEPIFGSLFLILAHCLTNNVVIVRQAHTRL